MPGRTLDALHGGIRDLVRIACLAPALFSRIAVPLLHALVLRAQTQAPASPAIDDRTIDRILTAIFDVICK